MPCWTCLTCHHGAGGPLQPAVYKRPPSVPAAHQLLPTHHPPTPTYVQIKARYENGTLTLDIPKREEATKEAKRITVA